MTGRLCWPLLLLELTACGPKPGEQHLLALREALMSVDSASARFEAADHDAALPAHARVDSVLAVVETRMQGFVVNLEQGRPFSVLDERRRMLKNNLVGFAGSLRKSTGPGDRLAIWWMPLWTVPKSIRRTPIDAAYLDQAAGDELRIARHLTEEVDIALDFLERGLRDLGRVLHRADSASVALSSIPLNPTPP